MFRFRRIGGDHGGELGGDGVALAEVAGDGGEVAAEGRGGGGAGGGDGDGA